MFKRLASPLIALALSSLAFGAFAPAAHADSDALVDVAPELPVEAPATDGGTDTGDAATDAVDAATDASTDAVDARPDTTADVTADATTPDATTPDAAGDATADARPAPPKTDDDDGCGCRVGGAQGAGSSTMALLAGLFGLVMVGRRARRR